MSKIAANPNSDIAGGSAGQPLVPDHLLPPVQPPSAGFLVQLFVIPGMIVLIIVLVWMMFHWLAQMGNDTESFVRALEGKDKGRWQAAVNLSNALRSDKNGTLKNDSQLAGRLAGILSREIKSGEMGEEPIMLRLFLCHTLGEFKVADGKPVLLEAAQTVRDEKEQPVQTAAIESLAVLTHNLREARKLTGGEALGDDPAVLDVVLSASRSDQPRLRLAASYALGEFSDPRANPRLVELLSDVSHPYVRYNAAYALSRVGDERVIDTLRELLATDEPPETDTKDSRQENLRQRTKLLIYGLRAAVDLAGSSKDADLTSLQAAVEKLTNDDTVEIRDHARGVLTKLQQR